MRLQAVLLAVATLVPLAACGGEDDEPLVCVALVACLDACAAGDTACEAACRDRAVPGAVAAATALEACIDASSCNTDDEACIEAACDDELVACGAVVDTGETDGGMGGGTDGGPNDGGVPTRVRVRGDYLRTDEPITAFVVANVGDAFDFEIPWPLANGSADPSNLTTSHSGYEDVRDGCLTPTAENELELFHVYGVEVIGSSIGVSSQRYVPAITRGVGEGDCAVDSTVDAAQGSNNSFEMSFPLEFFTTTPYGEYTVVDGYWTFVFVVD